MGHDAYFADHAGDYTRQMILPCTSGGQGGAGARPQQQHVGSCRTGTKVESDVSAPQVDVIATQPCTDSPEGGREPQR